MPLDLVGPYGLGPPADLSARVTVQFGAESADQARRDFFQTAVGHLRDHERALAGMGREFADFERILDFGCGPGRLTRLLTELTPAVDLHGVDVDPELVGWAAENIPEAQFVVGPHEPPLPYPDGHFDLIVNHSVFTHIDERYQDLWLGELRRVTRPGGLLLLTVHSTRQFNQALADMSPREAHQRRTALERAGLLFIADDTFIGTTHPDWYHTAFHAPWYVFEHWSSYFAIRAYIPEGSHSQDLVVLERTAAVDDPLLTPIGHGPAVDPTPSVAPVPAASDAPPIDPLAAAARTTDPYATLLESTVDTDDLPALIAEAADHASRLVRLGQAGRLRRVLGRGAADVPSRQFDLIARALGAVEAAHRGERDRSRAALTTGQADAARIDVLLAEVQRLRDIVGATAEGLGTLHEQLIDRDRIVGILRVAMDEQAHRTAAAIAELRQRTTRDDPETSDS